MEKTVKEIVAEIKEKVVERQLAFQSEVPVKQDELRSNPTS